MVSEPASHRGCQTKELFFMGSKGDGKHFVGPGFAWHGLESCCCSGVSEPASKGLAPKRQAFSHARPFAEMMSERRVIWLNLAIPVREIYLFFMDSKGDVKHFVGPGMASHRANGFGTSLAPRVPDKRTIFYGFQR